MDLKTLSDKAITRKYQKTKELEALAKKRIKEIQEELDTREEKNLFTSQIRLSKIHKIRTTYKVDILEKMTKKNILKAVKVDAKAIKILATEKQLKDNKIEKDSPAWIIKAIPQTLEGTELTIKA